MRQLLLALLLPLLAPAATTAQPVGSDINTHVAAPASQAQPSWSCDPAEQVEPVIGEGPLLRTAPPDPAVPPAAGVGDVAAAVPPADYRHRLATTALGRPRLDRWCVWIEPASGEAGSALWESRWRSAVDRALSHWQALLPIQTVADPSAAQVRLWRRRPPLTAGADGRLRASHGRATLALRRVRRARITRLEPAVEVLLSPAQREQGIEATALHELGHAFGLWGHSDDPADAMAAVPGAEPVLVLSRRDRATLEWLYRQPTVFGEPLPGP